MLKSDLLFADKATLSSILEKSDVTSDNDVIDRVFQALVSSSGEIESEVFAAFYQTWKQVRHKVQL